MPLPSFAHAALKRLALLALCGGVATAGADLAGDSCPVLPPGAGLTWTYQGGDDFGVCYAAAAGSPETVIGVYFGNAPTFDPARATAVSSGTVGGRPVTWYRRDSPAAGDDPGLQTLVYVSRRYVAHVWVVAGSAAQLQQRLSILAHMEFKP
jgi:hypothetical protein